MYDPAEQPLLLEARHVRTWFPIRRGMLSRVTGHVRAVDDVSFDIRRGETLALVGESGCGKTTIGRTLLGLETAREGNVLFEGANLLGLSVAAWRPFRRRLQMIFQDPLSSLNPRMTVLDILTEGPAHHGLVHRRREEIAERLLGEVGMDQSRLLPQPS